MTPPDTATRVVIRCSGCTWVIERTSFEEPIERTISYASGHARETGHILEVSGQVMRTRDVC